MHRDLLRATYHRTDELRRRQAGFHQNPRYPAGIPDEPGERQPVRVRNVVAGEDRAAGFGHVLGAPPAQPEQHAVQRPDDQHTQPDPEACPAPRHRTSRIDQGTAYPPGRPDGVVTRRLETMRDVMTWSIVVPVKRLAHAKSRLYAAGERRLPERSTLVLALALDTVAAALATPAVGRVVVVTDERPAAAALRELGAITVPDRPDAGLNPAL